MKTLRLLLPLLLLCSPLAAVQLADLVREHTAALGGMEKILALESLKAHGTIKIGERSLSVLAYAQKPNLVRNEVSAEGQRSVQAYDGKNPAWSWDASKPNQKPREMDGASAREFTADADFLDMLTMPEQRGITLSFLGRHEWNGNRYYCILATRTESEPVEIWLEARTHLIQRQLRNRKLSGGRVVQMETRFEDFRPVAGVMMPHRIQVFAAGRLLHETTLTNVEANPSLIPELFSIAGSMPSP